jgi:hypothetical protein
MSEIKVNTKTAEHIVYDDTVDWETAENEKAEDQDRWSTSWSKIVKHLSSGKFYKIFWSQGSTEMQDNGIEFYTDPVELVEVEWKEVTEFKWVEKP